MLSALLLFTPAMTGFSVAKVLESANSLSYNEVNGTELDELAQKAISDNGVQQLLEQLAGKEAKLVGKRAAKLQFNGHEGSVVLLYYKGKQDVQIFYGESGGKVKVGAGVYKITDRKTQAEAYDFVDGKIYHASTITVTKDSNGRPGKPSIEWHSSPLNPKNPKAIDSPPVSTLATNCDICVSVCNTIYKYGCGATGIIVCTVACAPFGGLACPLICGLIWIYLCDKGLDGNCLYVCRLAGYCP
jgi:hypothetical protein